MEIPSPGLFSRWLSNAIHFDEFDIESIWSCIIQQQACTGARTHRLNIKAFMCDIIPVCLILFHEHDSDAIKMASSAYKLSEQKSLNLRCMAKIIIILSVWCWNMFCLYATFDVRMRGKRTPRTRKNHAAKTEPTNNNTRKKSKLFSFTSFRLFCASSMIH